MRNIEKSQPEIFYQLVADTDCTFKKLSKATKGERFLTTTFLSKNSLSVLHIHRNNNAAPLLR